MEDSKPTFIIREASTADKDYVLWLSEVKERVRQYGDLSQKKSHQLGDLLEMPDIFGMIPWRHHVHIVSKATSLEEAIYYVNETIEGNWSRSMLEDSMAKGAFKAQSKALTNFSTKLPALQSRLAQEILKDPYNFDFLTMKQDYDEKDLEEALISNITNFLLELGQGLIICKSYDKTIVEWSLQDISKPLGVAAYQLQEVVERTVAELELKAKGRK